MIPVTAMSGIVHLRFRSVCRIGAVADILSAVEHSEGQASEKVSGGEIPCHWANDEA